MVSEQSNLAVAQNYGTSGPTNPPAPAAATAAASLPSSSPSNPQDENDDVTNTDDDKPPRQPDPFMDDIYGGLTREEWIALPFRERFRHQFSWPVLWRNFKNNLLFFVWVMSANIVFGELKERFEVRKTKGFWNGFWNTFWIGMLSYGITLAAMVLAYVIWACIKGNARAREKGDEEEALDMEQQTG